MITELFQQDFTYDAFISYHHSDEEVAKELFMILKDEQIDSRAFKPFYAPINLKPGFNFVKDLNDALYQARFYLLLLSENSLNSDWPVAEQSAAILKDPSGRLGRVIPIIVKSCRLPPLLQFRTYINLSKKQKKENQIKKLISLVTNKPIVEKKTTQQKDEISSFSSDSYKTDFVTEILYSNLFPLNSELPEIWGAPCKYNRKYEVKQELGNYLPPYILKNKKIYCFTNLSKKNIFDKIIFHNDLECIPIYDWIEEDDTRRWLIELLNNAIFLFSKERKLSFDYTSEKYFFRAGIWENMKIPFKKNKRISERSLVIPYSKNDKIIRYRHRAFKMNFLVIKNHIYFKIEPTILFTYDGLNPILDRVRHNVLCIRYISRQKNDAVFSELRFWSWLLSEDGKIININLGDSNLKIDIHPINIEIDRGIYGDINEIPEQSDIPPELIESEVELEEIEEDDSLDEEEMK